MTELVKHLKCSQETYSAIGMLNAGTMYFTEEFNDNGGMNAGRIYLGGTLVSRPSVWVELPEPLPEFAVDLGLPSGLKWADRNVGAASPESRGDYFMWGSTEPDTNNVCNWAHAPFNGGSSDFDETYFNAHKSEWVTDEGVLKPEYDAAHAIMGGSWRMPTTAEIQELLDGTTRSVEELNGVMGMRFTSKTNGNSVFMPLVGLRKGSGIGGAGSLCNTWSSSLYADDANYSYSLNFYSNGNSYLYVNDRYGGLVVRGVCQ